jgi:hypothetical protein
MGKNLINEIEKFNSVMGPYFDMEVEKIKEYLKKGDIHYHHLWYLFRPDSEVHTMIFDTPLGGIIKTSTYVEGFFSYFNVDFRYVQTNGESFYEKKDSEIIPRYEGTKSVKDLPLRPLAKDMKSRLSAR